MELRDQILEACGSEPPNDALVQQVVNAIGMPPKALTFTKLMFGFSSEQENEVCRVLDMLYKAERIDILNGWIHGVKKLDTSKWTQDDWDWIRGSGRFEQ